MSTVKVLLTLPPPPPLIKPIWGFQDRRIYTSWRYIKKYLWTASWNPDLLPVLHGNIHISGIRVFPTHRGLGRALMFRSIQSFNILPPQGHRDCRAGRLGGDGTCPTIIFLNHKKLVGKCLVPPPPPPHQNIESLMPPKSQSCSAVPGPPSSIWTFEIAAGEIPSPGIRLLVKYLAMWFKKNKFLLICSFIWFNCYFCFIIKWNWILY